ncbi:ZIP family metal transporter [Flavobacteriaceae bacterium M23B6Z8]
MINYVLPILAVLCGLLLVLVIKPEKKGNLKLLLAFSGAFLLSLTVFDLLPEVYTQSVSSEVGIFIMSGIFIQIFLEFFSKGAEHGHVHVRKGNPHFPWLLFSSLSIHSILEGFPLHLYESLVFGIVIHKIPIAMILTSFFLDKGISRIKVTVLLVIFAFMTPLGSLLSDNLSFIQPYLTQISAIVIGIFLHISTTILFESSEGHTFNIRKLTVIALGVITAYFI